MSRADPFSALRRRVRHDGGLSAQARLLFADVCDLSERDGHCKAGDVHFAKRYAVERRTVRRWIKELRDAGYVRVEGATNSRTLHPAEPPSSEEPEGQLRTRDDLKHRTQDDLNGDDLGHLTTGSLGHSASDTKSINTPQGGEAREGAREEPPATGQEGFDPEAEYRAAFPDFTPAATQIPVLRSFDDVAAFRATLDVWLANAYQPRHLSNFRDRYRKIQAGERGADGHLPSPGRDDERTGEVRSLTDHML